MRLGAGDQRGALRALDKHLQAEPLDAQILVVAVALAVSVGEAQTAQRYSRRLLLMEPDAVLANLLASQVFSTEPHYAAVRMQKVLQRLASLQPDDPLPLAPDLNARAVLRMVKTNEFSDIVKQIQHH